MTGGRYWNEEFKRHLNVVPCHPGATAHLMGVQYGTTDAEQMMNTQIDHTDEQSPVKDQGQTEFCFAYSAASEAEPETKKITGANGQGVLISPHFIGWNTEYLEGVPNQDVGAQDLHDVVKAMTNWGLASEAVCPTNPANVVIQPGQDAYADGASRLITRPIFHLNTPQNLVAALFAGRTFCVGIPVYRQFMVAPRGLVNMPSLYDTRLGGHAILVVGRVKIGNNWYWKIKNSYGTSWGDQGYGYLLDPYVKYFFDPYSFSLAGVAAPKETAEKVAA